MTVISGTLIGPYGEALPGVTIEMVAVRTTATVLEQASSRFVTDTNGRYSLKVEPGRYNVMVSASGQPAARVGSIIVELTSLTGTLNDFLTKPGEEDLTPEIVKTVDQMRAAAANSAAAAKVSENNSAAAMTNALSKVNTADQSVTSTVLFGKPIRLTSATSLNFTPSSQGAWVSWNRTNSSDDGIAGATDFINHRGGRTIGGWNFWDTDGTTTKLMAKIAFNGAMRIMGSFYSYTDQHMQADDTTPNLLLRFKDSAGVEKSSIYAQTDTGQLNIRWGGTARVISCNPNGTVNFPGAVYSGTTALLKVGDYGVGGTTAVTYSDTTNTGQNMFYNTPANTAGAASNVASAGIIGGYDGGSRWQLGWEQGALKVALATRVRVSAGTWSPWYAMWHAGNTTVDANGFLKKASPIVKLFGDGSCELNAESQGVTIERLSEGVYRVSGVLGFNADGAWGGAGNGIEIPVDDNKRPLVWVESKVLPDGDIEIRTYHRTYDTGPYSARNIEAMDSGEVDKKNQPIFVEMPDGTPIDIPVGRFIDLRVEMPAVDEPEPDLEPELEPELETEPEAVEPTEPTIPEPIPEPGVDPEPSPAVAEEGDELDRPVSDRKPIF